MTETQIALLVLQVLAKYGPEAAETFRKLITAENITLSDVDKFIAEVKVMDFWQISGLPKPPGV
jgi:hypothetical protein